MEMSRNTYKCTNWTKIANEHSQLSFIEYVKEGLTFKSQIIK